MPDPAVRVARIDIMLALFLAVLAIVIATLAMMQMPDSLYSANSFNIWFQADQPRSIMAMADRMSKWHDRDNVHPLFSVIIFPIVHFIGLFGFSTLASCKIFILGVGFFSEFFLFLTLRHMAVDRVRSTLGCIAFLSSATFLHWFSLVETFAPSSLTVIICTYLFVRRSPPSAAMMIVASVVSIAMVITNWTLGLALTISKVSFGKFIRYSIAALAVCLCFSVAQKQIFPRSGYFFSPKTLAYEQRYVSIEEADEHQQHTVVERIQSFFVTSAVAPFAKVSSEKWSSDKILTNQYIGFSNYNFIGIIAISIWVVLLIISLIGAISSKKTTPVFLGLSMFVLFQALLHSVYGEITFLYVGDYFPALLILMCVGGSLRWRHLHSALLVAFIMFGAVANSQAFLSAAHMAGELAEGRAGAVLPP